MLVDLHVHVGPRGLPIDQLVARAPQLGLDGLALIGDDQLPDLAPWRGTSPLRLFAGAEVATDRGHYLVFFPKPAEIPSLDEVFGHKVGGVWHVRDVVARTRALGGAVVALHPYDRTDGHRAGDILYTLPSLNAVETVSPTRPPDIAQPAIEAAETLGIPCVGGSCARRSLDELGRGATLFTRPLADESQLVDALHEGECWAVQFGDPPADLLRRPPPAREGGGPPERGGGDHRRRRRR